MSEHVPMLVSAHLAQGYVTSDPWSPALDGILAYWALREQLGEEEFALGGTGYRPLVEAELPLAREQFGDAWWWCVSSPIEPGGARQVFERWYHRRFDDDRAVRYLPAKTTRIETAAGPYKNYRNRALARLVPRLVWAAIGDSGEVERLLRRCTSIGQGLARGWGVVTRWEVEPAGEAARELALTHRPLPVGVPGAQGIELEWGIRPPGRAHRIACVMP